MDASPTDRTPPAITDVTPQESELMATRSAINGTLADRSRAISIRNGARVVPLAATVNMASDATANSGHGIRACRAKLPAARDVLIAVISTVPPVAHFGPLPK